MFPRPVSLALALAITPACGPRPTATAPPTAPAPASSDPAISDGPREVNGTNLYVKRIGRGDAILVVHGGPVLEHGYLLPHLEPLADSNELIFYDQRLSGRSDGTVPPESVRLATFVADIEALRVDLGLDRFHLMAHSWGGLLALLYTVEHGEHVGSLVLLDSMSASSSLWQQEEKALAERANPDDAAEAAAIKAAEDGALRPETIAKLLRISFRGQFHDPARAEELQFYIPEDYGDRSKQFAAMIPDLQDFDYHADLAAIEAPTLLVYGAAEPGAELGGRALQAAIPNATFELIPDAGHFPFLEQPDTFLGVVRGFLARHPL